MVQVNVVVPQPAADLVRRVGRGLREIDDFPESLRRFLDGEAGIPVQQRQTLAQQVADAVVAALMPVLERQEANLAAVTALHDTDSAGAPRKRAPQPPRRQLMMDI